MSVSFKVRTVRKFGEARLTARIQYARLGLNLLVATPIKVDIAQFCAPKNGRTFNSYMRSPEGQLIRRLELRIECAVQAIVDSGVTLDPSLARKVIENACLQECCVSTGRSPGVSLREFIETFQNDISSGKRLTDDGNIYAPGTIHAIDNACKTLKQFELQTGHIYDFNEIDLRFYNEYMSYLKQQNYAVNTCGKCIKILKHIMALAEAEGYHGNARYKDKRFKVTKVDVDNIYLTKDELGKIMQIDEADLSPSERLSRDIFMVGVWTAQRVSDYNHIRKEDIQTITKRWIADIPDPRKPGQSKARIQQKEITCINIRQKKTGVKVAVPCSSELKHILEKYSFQIPHQSEAVLNRNLKSLGRKAGLTETISVESTKGGRTVIERIEKYKLIQSHTARRTGATLMYLAGMDIYDIMKITGHRSPMVLRKYIKADQLEIVEKITAKYDYFD